VLRTELETAIRHQKVIQFTYSGYEFTAEPYRLASDNTGATFLDVYQTGQGTSHAGTPKWRRCEMSRISHITPTDKKFRIRDDYSKQPKAEGFVFAEV